MNRANTSIEKRRQHLFSLALVMVATGCTQGAGT